jgi:hypothetical protein
MDDSSLDTTIAPLVKEGTEANSERQTPCFVIPAYAGIHTLSPM